MFVCTNNLSVDIHCMNICPKNDFTYEELKIASFSSSKPVNSESHMSLFVSPFLSEQRKKYSNSNVIMQETSQYHVQVSEMLNSFISASSLQNC